MESASRSSVARVRASFEEEARRFIARHDLADVVDAVLALVADCFPDLCALRVTAEEDPEIPDCESLCLEATVRGTVEEVLAGEDAFDDAVCRQLRPEQRRLVTLVVTIAD